MPQTFEVNSIALLSWEVTVMQGHIKYMHTLFMLSKHLNSYTCVKYFRNIPFGYFKFIPSLLP